MMTAASSSISPAVAADSLSASESRQLEPALVLERQRAAHERDGSPSRARRIEWLTRLESVVRSNRAEIVDAISTDFGHRSRHETELYELTSVMQGIRYLKRHLAAWMRPSRRAVAWQFAPAAARVEYEPCGVIGVMAPWNYPVALALNPLAVALAAGNRVVLKPSEKTPLTAGLVQRLLREAFDDTQVAVVLGDAAAAAAFSRLPFDHLVFTGGTATGRAVMAAASDHLVPVTLELGGKSPVVIEPRCALPFAAERIAFGKLLNAGQTCIAPDYVLVPLERRDEFVAHFGAAVDRMYPNIATTSDYTSIANDEHFARLRGMLEEAEHKGARVLRLGRQCALPMHGRTFLPALVLDPTDDMQIMREEIFGPILPVVAYKHVDEAIAKINALGKPLAVYYFGANGPTRALVRQATASGAFVANDTILHYAQEDLPFGGVGASGMGAYHGREGFLRMSHARAVYSQSRFSMARFVGPPFGSLVERIVRLMLR